MNSSSPAPAALKMSQERLAHLLQLAEQLNAMNDLPALLDFALDTALSATGGQRGLLLLSHPTAPAELEIAAARGEKLAQAERERILAFIGAAGVSEALAQDNTPRRLDWPADSGPPQAGQSALAVPLTAHHRLVGLLYLDHPGPGAFDQLDLDFLAAFAGQAALAIDRTRRHQRQIEELALINELSRGLVKVLDLNQVLTRIVAEVTRMLNVEASSVLLLDEATSELVFSTSVYKGRRLSIPTRLSTRQGLAGWVMTHGEALCVNDVEQDPRWFGEVETGFKTRSLLCVPLQMDERTVGVLQALNKQGGHGFNADDQTLLSAFAASATIAIENARLFHEARQARQLRALNRIGMSLSSNLDLEAIIREGLQQTLAVLQADAGAITLGNQRVRLDLPAVQVNPNLYQGDQTRLAAAAHELAVWLTDQKCQDFSGDDVFIIDAQHPPGPNTAAALQSAAIQAVAVAPIHVAGGPEGSLSVMTTAPHTYTLEEISLLNGIARLVGLAAQNAMHYLQMQAQTVHLKYLNEIGSALTRSLDVDHVLKVIIDGVNTLLQTELTSIFLIDDDTNELVLRYTTKGDADIRLSAPWQGIAGWVATHDQPALVNDTHSDPRHLRQVAIDTGYQAHSILCVPLKVEGQIIGVVEVLNKIGGQQFTHYHQLLLMELTKWAAIALHNARLFDERVQAYQRLNAEQERRVAAETRGAMATIILDMAHTMNNVVGAIRAWALALEYAVTDAPDEALGTFEKQIIQIRQNTEEALKLMSTMTGPLEHVAVAPVDVRRCLDAAIDSCWWPEQVTLTTTFADNVPLVEANAERLEAVFHNLLSNAIQALNQAGGGRIDLTASRSSSGQAAIIISDNGPGIPPELQERIFNPGVSGKQGSLGIGLWLVETFVHQLEGRIAFTSDAGGTTFTVTLPPAGPAHVLINSR